MTLLTGKRFLALRCAILIGVGLVLGLLLPWPWWIGVILAGLSVTAVIFLSEKFLYLTLLFLAVSYGRASLPSPMPKEIYGFPLEIEARLIGKTGSYSVLKIEEPQGLKGHRVLVYLTKDEESGTKLKIKGKLLPLAFPRNPGIPDRNQRLNREGVIGRFSAGEIVKTAPPEGLRAWLNKTREAFIQRNRELFGQEAAIYTAILLGERSKVPEDLYLDMKRTGTLHLLAVSGLHVGVLVAFLFLLLRFFHVPRWMIPPVLAILLCFYIALVGPRASIIRASVMSLAVAAGFAFERKVLPLNSLAIAALILLLVRPTDILSVGFQLSFAAAFGIILAAAGTREMIAREKIKGKIPSWLVKWIILPLALSVFATLFTMPFLAAHFHRITFGPILANLPVIPLVSLVLPLGLVALALSLIWFPLGQILGFAVFGLLWIVEKLLQLLPGSLISSGAWPIGLVVAIFLTALIFHTEKIRPKRFVYALVMLLLGANLAIWPWALRSRRPRLTLLDTYHGNVAALQADGRTILLNPGSRAEPSVADFLESRGIRRIDWILCLSDKAGDLSGLDSLKTRFRIEEIGSVLKDEGTTLLPHAGRLILSSCTISYDLAMRERPFYVIQTDRRRVVFTSEFHRMDEEADVNVLLNRYIKPKETEGRLISKTRLKQGESEVIRKHGGMVIGL